MSSRYTDLYQLTKNKHSSLPQRGRNGTTPRGKKNSSWLKSILFIFSFAIVVYTVKIFITPVGHVLGSFLTSSATTISIALSGRELKNDQGVTNVLIVGLDKRSVIPYSYKGPGGVVEKNGFNTDTIIIASFNKNTGSATLLSVPRDLWVDIPGFNSNGTVVQPQQGRINSIMAIGDQFNYPGGGIPLLAKVIEGDLGIPIHYWVRVDFQALVKAVNAVSGVDVYVDRSFTDFMYPIEGQEDASWGQRYKTVSFTQGLTHMDGQTALEFSRSRHSIGPEGSDFARAQRQHKVIVALKDKVLSTDTLFDLNKIKSLYDILTNPQDQNILTNVELADLPIIYATAQKFSLAQVQSYVLDDGTGPGGLLYNPPVEQFSGAWVLIPKGGGSLNENFQAIRNFVHQIFYNPLAPAPTAAPSVQ